VPAVLANVYEYSSWGPKGDIGYGTDVEWKIPGTGRTLDYFLRYIGGSTDHEQYFRWQEPMPTRYH
jgi:hypothetical protein